MNPERLDLVATTARQQISRVNAYLEFSNARLAHVLGIKAKIAANTYEDEHKIDVATEQLLPILTIAEGDNGPR